MLQARDRGLTIIFARTKRTVAKVADELGERGFAVGAIHGDLGQGAREQAMRAFRKGKVDVLVATDVAARGIDVDDVTHVVNYQCPEDEKTYLHRIGRTGRAGNTGTAVTFVDWEDMTRWSLIDKALDLGIPEPVETYSSSPHLFEDLDIPEGTRGTLPRASRTRAGLDAEAVEDLGETGQKGPRGSRRGASDAEDRSRSRRRRGSEETGGADADATRDEQAQTGDRPARSRPRRRTRAGVPVDGSAPEATVVELSSETAPAGGESDRRPRRRRRRRGSGQGAPADTDAVDVAVGE
jgi:superfamily II DNA/RNA helicase